VAVLGLVVWLLGWAGLGWLGDGIARRLSTPRGAAKWPLQPANSHSRGHMLLPPWLPMLLTLSSRHFCDTLQAKAVYQERSPINALGSFNKPIAFFQVRLTARVLPAAQGFSIMRGWRMGGAAAAQHCVCCHPSSPHCPTSVCFPFVLSLTCTALHCHCLAGLGG
jgi:hypothetical protein